MGARTRGIANNILSDGLDATDGLSGALSSDNIANASVTNVTSTPSIGGGFEKLASDPPSPTEGDIWYNTTSNTVKGYVYAPGAWASGGGLSTARSALMGSVGTQTSTLVGGGGPGTSATEEYDGSSWTAGGSRSTSFFRVSNLGTQTAALGFGGYSPSPIPTAPQRYSISTEEYDGSTWTAGGNFPNGIQTAGATGTQTAGLQASGIFGPYTTAPSVGTSGVTQEYDGASWTAGGTMPNGGDLAGASGTQTAALSIAGRGPIGGGQTNTNRAIAYDGTTWTSITNYPLSVHGNVGFGIQTATVVAGGSDPSGRVSTTNIWDGSSWTSTGSLNTVRNTGIGGGTTTSGILSAGSNPGGASTLTEEFTGAGTQVKTLG